MLKLFLETPFVLSSTITIFLSKSSIALTLLRHQLHSTIDIIRGLKFQVYFILYIEGVTQPVKSLLLVAYPDKQDV